MQEHSFPEFRIFLFNVSKLTIWAMIPKLKDSSVFLCHRLSNKYHISRAFGNEKKANENREYTKYRSLFAVVSLLFIYSLMRLSERRYKNKIISFCSGLAFCRQSIVIYALSFRMKLNSRANELKPLFWTRPAPIIWTLFIAIRQNPTPASTTSVIKLTVANDSRYLSKVIVKLIITRCITRACTTIHNLFALLRRCR